MSFNENDFLYIDYELFDNDVNKIISTSDKEKAEKEHIYKPELSYGKILFIIGSSKNLKALNREIMSMNIGESKEIILKPDEAFGEYKKDLVKVMHLSDFRANKIEPYPGMKVNLDNTIATIKTINSGRVMVDFNNELAGKNILYKIKVIEKINSDENKIKAYAEFNNIEIDKVNISADFAEIMFGTKINKYEEKFIVKKFNLLTAIFLYMPNIKQIKVNEEYEKNADIDESIQDGKMNSI